MDKRRKSTKEVDDNDGVSLSIMKMAQQGGEHAGGRERERGRGRIASSGAETILIFLQMSLSIGQRCSHGTPWGPVFELGAEWKRKRERLLMQME